MFHQWRSLYSNIVSWTKSPILQSMHIYDDIIHFYQWWLHLSFPFFGDIFIRIYIYVKIKKIYSCFYTVPHVLFMSYQQKRLNWNIVSWEKSPIFHIMHICHVMIHLSLSWLHLFVSHLWWYFLQKTIYHNGLLTVYPQYNMNCLYRTHFHQKTILKYSLLRKITYI